MKIQLIILAALSASGAWAQDQCSYVDSKGKSVPVSVTWLDDGAIMRIRSLGSVPDRYFADVGKGDHVQFATRASGSSPLKLEKVSSSVLTVDTSEKGGSHYYWRQGRRKVEISCSSP